MNFSKTINSMLGLCYFKRNYFSEKSSEPKTNERACCRAATAECLACAEGTGVDDYCYMNRDTVGCDGK